MLREYGILSTQTVYTIDSLKEKHLLTLKQAILTFGADKGDYLNQLFGYKPLDEHEIRFCLFLNTRG